MSQKKQTSKADQYKKQYLKPKNEYDQIRGTCYSMCSLEETNLRIEENMVHVLEKWGNKYRLVKRFTRSAADMNLAVPLNLRPYNILYATVTYLLFEVAQRDDVSMVVKYDFIDDRLRAVRQDMTIQRLSLQQCAHLLEPMIRFYVYFGYQLHGLPVVQYDKVLQTKQLFECYNWFHHCCDKAANLKLTAPDDPTDFELVELMSDLKINQGENWLAFDPPLIEAMYILSSLHYGQYGLNRSVRLPPYMKKDPRVQLASELGSAVHRGNFVRVASKSVVKLCPLSFCAFAPYLPHFQRRTIHVLAKAFNSMRLGMKARDVQKWAAFASVDEAVQASEHYGLPVVKDGDGDSFVVFDISKFKDVAMHECKIQRPHENIDIPYVFTYEHSEHTD